MNSLVHGGDWAGFQLEYGAPPLDFSSNVSPLGVPERVRDAAARALSAADRYRTPCAGSCVAQFRRRSRSRRIGACAAAAPPT